MSDAARMVEIPLSHARLLAKAMGVVADTPICQELLGSLENAIGLAEVRSIRDRVFHRTPVLLPPLVRPRWDYVARAIRVIEGMSYRYVRTCEAGA